jgi:hypothetical protein
MDLLVAKLRYLEIDKENGFHLSAAQQLTVWE